MTWRSVILLALSWAAVAPAQTGFGNVQGTVKDASGAVIPGASVSLTHTQTSRQFQTTTNDVGFYLFPSAQSGDYSIAVEAPGMEGWKGRFLLQTGQTAVVDAALKVGATTTEVTVAADVAPLVTTTAPTLANIAERARIEQLPISGRMFQSLVSQTTPGLDGPSWVPRAWGLRWAVEFLQDGAVLANRDTGEIAGRPPGLDTIEEFRAETNVSSAKMNRPATVIVSTRSGTNLIHGSVFEVLRDNNLGFGVARQRQDLWSRPPHFVRNEFGGSFGGPVVLPKVYNGRNRTFFFGSYEAFRSYTKTTKYLTVPTMAMRQGDFSGLVDGSGRRYTLYDPWTTASRDENWRRLPFPNNQIPMQRQSPLAKYLYSQTPEPTLPDNPLVRSNYFYQAPNNRVEHTETFRVDHRLSDNDQLFARFTNGYRWNIQQSGNNNSPITSDLAANAIYRNIANTSAVLSWNHTFSPTFFSETVFNVGTEDQMHEPVNYDQPYADRLGMPNPFNETGFPNLTSTGFDMEYVTATNRRNNISHVFNLDENFTKIRGRHELQFGGRLRYERLNVLPDQQQVQGAHAFASGATALFDPSSGSAYGNVPYTGHNAANVFIGVIGSYSAQFVRKWYYLTLREHALYFQDNFKLNSRLTLNFGVRWEINTPIRERNNMLTGFDLERKAIVNGAPMDVMIREKATIPSIVKVFDDMGVKFISPREAGLPERMMHLNWWDFGPRAGFAYKLTEGRRSFVVRGGYGIYGYPMPLRAFNARMRQNPPTTARFTYQLGNSAQTPDRLPNWGARSAPQYIAGVNSRDVLDISQPGSVSRGSFLTSYFDPRQATSRAHEWNLTFEKEILDNTVVRFGYVGTHGLRLDQYYSFNQGPNAYIWYTTTGLPLPTGTYSGTATRNFEKTMFGDIERYQKTGWSNAQNFQIEVQRRYSKGYGFQWFYVMANALKAAGGGWEEDTLQTPNMFLPGAVPVDDSARNRLLYYRRDTEIPKHRMNWNWIVDLPLGRGKKWFGNAGGVLDRVAGGWQIAGQGSVTSTWWSLPTGNWAFPNPMEIYGTKYKIQDCRSGACYDGYLYYNGYIPANRINSVDAAGKPNGVMGVPANYKPAHAPLIPMPADGGRRDDPLFSFYDSNTVWVPMKDGSLQRTTYNNNLHPWRNQYFSGLYNWYTNASLFKVIRVNERVFFRLNTDFFNVFNIPGIPKTPNTTTGIISTQNSGNGARALQFGLRLTW